MKAPLQYLEHTTLMAEYYSAVSPGRGEEPSQQDFETIYEDALDVKYGGAKEYLASLDDEAMETIRRFHHLAEDIKVDQLDEEGAYNLLVHRYEQLDFNGDGLIQSGAAQTISLLPQEMPNDFKASIVETVALMKDEGYDYFRDISPIMMQLHLTFNPQVLARALDKAGAGVNLPEPRYDYQALVEIQESLHHPKGGAYASEKYVKDYDRFMEILGSVIEKNGDAVVASRSDEGASKSDSAVASFFDRVRAAGGALNFIQQLNMEKIEKLIEEKRKELEEKLGVNAEPPLPDEVRVKLFEEIEAILEQYKKDLLEDMKKRSGPKGFDKDAYLRMLIDQTVDQKEEETPAV